MNPGRIVRRFPGWGLLPLLLVLVACGPDRVETPPGQDQQQVLDREATVQTFRNRFDSILRSYTERPCDQIPLPVGNAVHDCQRLVGAEEGARVFGPLVGILPDTSLHDLNEVADFANVPRRVAYVVNSGYRERVAGDTVKREVAEGYAPLQIPPGTPSDPETRCLWLTHQRQAGQWRAAMAPCGRAPDSTAFTLQVERQIFMEGASPAPLDRYPKTARWLWTGDRTELGGQHYIGLPCADGWCAVGESGFTPKPIPRGSAADYKRKIPGWHDAQFLAVQPPDDDPYPGPWGVVYPEQSVASAAPSWTDVASIEVFPGLGSAGAIGGYQSSFHLQQATSNPDLWASTIQIRHPGASVEARYRRSAADLQAAPVVYQPGIRHTAEGAARWRWAVDDETAWTPCPGYGCCDIGHT